MADWMVSPTLWLQYSVDTPVFARYQCAPCDTGAYCTSGVETPCAVGKATKLIGADTCTSCAAGTYASGGEWRGLGLFGLPARTVAALVARQSALFSTLQYATSTVLTTAAGGVGLSHPHRHALLVCCRR